MSGNTNGNHAVEILASQLTGLTDALITIQTQIAQMNERMARLEQPPPPPLPPAVPPDQFHANQTTEQPLRRTTDQRTNYTDEEEDEHTEYDSDEQPLPRTTRASRRANRQQTEPYARGILRKTERNRSIPYDRDPHNRDYGDRHRRDNEGLARHVDPKITAPTFAGRVNPEAYLDWERRLDNIFDCYEYPNRKKISFAVAQLTEGVLAWWDREVADRRRYRTGPIDSWDEMKRLMRRRYVPSYYHRELQKQF